MAVFVDVDVDVIATGLLFGYGFEGVLPLRPLLPASGIDGAKLLQA